MSSHLLPLSCPEAVAVSLTLACPPRMPCASPQTARVLRKLLPGTKLRACLLNKATAAGSDFSKVRHRSAAATAAGPDLICLSPAKLDNPLPPHTSYKCCTPSPPTHTHTGLPLCWCLATPRLLPTHITHILQ